MNTVDFRVVLWVEEDGVSIRSHEFRRRMILPRVPMIDETVLFAAEHWQDEDISLTVSDVITDTATREMIVELEGMIIDINEEDEKTWTSDFVACKFDLYATTEAEDLVE